MTNIIPLSFDDLTSANLMTSIKVECIPRTEGENLPFREEGTAVDLIANPSLSDNPVFVLTAKQLHRLSVTLIHDHVAQAPIKKVISITAAFSEQSTMELPICQRKASNTMCKAVALLDPQELKYEELCKPSSTSDMHGKSVPLDLVIALTISDDYAQALELKHRVHLHITSQKPRFRKFTRKTLKCLEDNRTWAKESQEASIFFSQISMKL